MTAPLLAVTLCLLLAAGPAWAADDGGEVVISVGQPDSLGVVSTAQSDSLGVVSTAQSDGGTDTEPGTDRRLVGRESGERVDAVVIALWTIAGVMTVLLGIFLWHTSPRRRLRLAAASAELFDAAEGSTEPSETEPSEDESTEDESQDDLPERDLGGRVRDALLRLRSMVTPQHDSGPADDDSQPESVEESEDESAVWKFGEENGEENEEENREEHSV